MEYLSDKLIKELSSDKLPDITKRAIIRSYFIKIHKAAVEETIVAMNKNTFVFPNFEDKPL